MAVGPLSNRAGDAASRGQSTDPRTGVAGRCGYCGQACLEQDRSGVWFRRMEHLLLLRIGTSPIVATLVKPTATPEVGALRPRVVVREPGSGQYTTPFREATGARHAGAAREAWLRARTLCEDIDEGLCLAIEASRHRRASIVTSALGRVTRALARLLDSLGVQSVERSATTGATMAEPLRAALAMVPRLDIDLRAAIHGDRDAGRRARQEALGLLFAVEAELSRSSARRVVRRSPPRAHALDVAGQEELAACG
jgi:hypothetical protein